MRKPFALLFMVFFLLSGCVTPQNEVLESLGNYSEIAYFTSGGFQDYTDYAKYQIKSPDLENNHYFKRLNSGSFIAEFLGYINNFEMWVETIGNELEEGYDFDRAIVNENDYAYMYSDPDYNEKYDCYDVYFYDAETNTVYYFHNNI